ncbi:MAG: alpha/beta fold hydrolase [Novosphingobium sp.]|nr:alpha/beta fold hydrolase [Novosphingobium sp.]
MQGITTSHIASFDGVKLAVHRCGKGRPVVLLHGLFSNAQVNWVKFGHASCLVEAGFEVIMPDLRAHGQSDAPRDEAAYPQFVLVRDLVTLVDALGLTDFDLAGFSLGARTAAEAVTQGLMPRRLVLAGMGLQGLTGWTHRAQFFLDMIERFDSLERGDPAWMAAQFMKTMKIDHEAARCLLMSIRNQSVQDLAAITMPTLVLCGDEDNDNGPPDELADLLPDGRLKFVPGTHMSSVTKPDLGVAIAAFLSS